MAFNEKTTRILTQLTREQWQQARSALTLKENELEPLRNRVKDLAAVLDDLKGTDQDQAQE